MAMTYNEKRKCVVTYDRYHVWTDGVKGDLLVVTGDGEMIYLGDL